MVSNFERMFYNVNEKKEDETQQLPESLFYDVVKVKIKSLKSFISWLLLKKHISNTVKVNDGKPMSLVSLPLEKKISTLVKNVKNIKDLALEFNKTFGDIENKKVE